MIFQASNFYPVQIADKGAQIDEKKAKVVKALVNSIISAGKCDGVHDFQVRHKKNKEGVDYAQYEAKIHYGGKIYRAVANISDKHGKVSGKDSLLIYVRPESGGAELAAADFGLDGTVNANADVKKRKIEQGIYDETIIDLSEFYKSAVKAGSKSEFRK